MKTLSKIAIIFLACQLLTGCLVAAAGAGAAGGYYFNKHYRIVNKSSHS